MYLKDFNAKAIYRDVLHRGLRISDMSIRQDAFTRYYDITLYKAKGIYGNLIHKAEINLNTWPGDEKKESYE